MVSERAPITDTVDRAARIESVMRLASKISRQYRPCLAMSRDDWHQEALKSSIEAVDNFDPTLNLTLGQWVGLKINWDLQDIVTRLCRRSIHTECAEPDQLPDRDDTGTDDFDDLWQEIDKLPRKDRTILIGAYGLDGKKALPFAELARRQHKAPATIYASRRRSLGVLRLSMGARA